MSFVSFHPVKKLVLVFMLLREFFALVCFVLLVYQYETGTHVDRIRIMKQLRMM